MRKLTSIPTCSHTHFRKSCQDISNAGERKGFSKQDWENGESTRSGMLWEVERILKELHELDPINRSHMPQILLMENVSALLSESNGNLNNMRMWEDELSKLGYSSYLKVMNAKDFGGETPQNRERAFMISLLGEYVYTFPSKQKLVKRNRDLLEKNVDEKYFLSVGMYKCFTAENTGNYPRKDRFYSNVFRENKDVANAVTTMAGARPTDNFVIEEWGCNNSRLLETLEKNGNVIEDGAFIDAYNRSVNNDLAGTITTRTNDSSMTFVAVEDDNYQEFEMKRGYNVKVKKESEEDSDGVEYLGSYAKNGFSQCAIVGKNGISPTFTDNHGEVIATVVEDEGGEYIPFPNATNKGYEEAYEGDSVDLEALTRKGRRGTVQHGLTQTIKTSPTLGVVVKDPIGGKFLRIRKYTPLETSRLMHFRDEDYYRMSEVLSDREIWHICGDSICVNCLYAIIKQLC